MMTRTELILIWHTEALAQENDELRRQNKVLLDRLHQYKRRNREDKVKLRNEIGSLKYRIENR